MTQTLAVENGTLEQLILLYGLELVDSEEFFREWQDDLPELTNLRIAAIGSNKGRLDKQAPTLRELKM
ncbi:hypothetical protein [uncultured Nostoc sp.]|uniref:hypothetical protein n=1 Tax=uncultured Nostoc sp. TaxID=340711 RepID=UPI0035CB8A63